MTDFSFGESHTSRPVRPEFSPLGNDIQGMFDPTTRRGGAATWTDSTNLNKCADANVVMCEWSN